MHQDSIHRRGSINQTCRCNKKTDFACRWRLLTCHCRLKNIDLTWDTPCGNIYPKKLAIANNHLRCIEAIITLRCEWRHIARKSVEACLPQSFLTWMQKRGIQHSLNGMTILSEWRNTMKVNPTLCPIEVWFKFSLSSWARCAEQSPRVAGFQRTLLAMASQSRLKKNRNNWTGGAKTTIEHETMC